MIIFEKHGLWNVTMQKHAQSHLILIKRFLNSKYYETICETDNISQNFKLGFSDQTYLEILFWFFLYLQWRVIPLLNILLFGAIVYLPVSITPWPFVWAYTRIMWLTEPFLMVAEVNKTAVSNFWVLHYLLKLLQKFLLGTANKMKQFYHDLWKYFKSQI